MVYFNNHFRMHFNICTGRVLCETTHEASCVLERTIYSIQKVINLIIKITCFMHTVDLYIHVNIMLNSNYTVHEVLLSLLVG